MERAFRGHAEGRTLAPAALGVAAAQGAFHVKAAGLKGVPAYFAAKTNANFPGNPSGRGLPAIQGVIVLCDADDGFPLAVMDSIEVTARRTAAVTALAARLLARAGSQTLTLCGCGAQGRAQLRALCRVLPLRRVYAFDADSGRAQRFARELSEELQLEVSPVDDLTPAVRHSDVCVTCTPSRRALLFLEDLSPGAFVAAVGSDSPEKQELDPRLVASSTLVVDWLDSCAELGELHHALAAGLMRREDVHAELAELVAGRRPGRRSADEIVVFDSTGTALADVAAAALAYESATACGVGLLHTLGG